MIKLLAASAALLLLAGCGSREDSVPLMPPTNSDLSDCSLSVIRVDTGRLGKERLFVVRCPNATVTTMTAGKNPTATVTVTGPQTTAEERAGVADEDRYRREMIDRRKTALSKLNEEDREALNIDRNLK